MPDTKILVADDHPLFLRGIVDFLHQLRYHNILMAKDGLSALQHILDHQPDIAILDIEMPYLTGLEVAIKAKEKGISTKFILISYQQDVMIVRMAEKLNVSAYILKEDSLSLLEKCLYAVKNGNTYFSSSIDTGQTAATSNPAIQHLTPTEKRILRLIAEDKTSKHIADEYGVSVRTIEKHRSNIIQKLDLPGSPTSLFNWAREHKKYL